MPAVRIEKLEFRKGASMARGAVVIIDVFRAFSVACYAFDAGAARVIATATVESALALRKQYRNSVLAGERNERKIEGFDFGNSPTEIIRNDLSGMTFIHTTTAGTQGLAGALHADRLLAASIVNAGATADYLMSIKADLISLVAMGYRATLSAEEDCLCADMIQARLEGAKADWSERIASLRTTSGSRFFKPENIDFSPPTDFFLCTMTDRFSFALRAERRPDGNIDLARIDI